MLFSYLSVPKSSYYNVLQAYKDAGFTGGNQGGSSQTLPNGWYYIKNINAQKYLQVKDNAGGNGVNVEIGWISSMGQKRMESMYRHILQMAPMPRNLKL